MALKDEFSAIKSQRRLSLISSLEQNMKEESAAAGRDAADHADAADDGGGGTKAKAAAGPGPEQAAGGLPPFWVIGLTESELQDTLMLDSEECVTQRVTLPWYCRSTTVVRAYVRVCGLGMV